MSRRSQRLLLAGAAKKSGPANTSASPGFRFSATPCNQVTVSPRAGVRSTSRVARIAFHSGRAVMVSTVSKVCGVSSGPGTLCTCKPVARVRVGAMPVMKAPGSGGRPGGGVFGASSAKASQVSAATPGRSR